MGPEDPIGGDMHEQIPSAPQKAPGGKKFISNALVAAIFVVILAASAAFTFFTFSFCGFSSGFSFECSILPRLSLASFFLGVVSVSALIRIFNQKGSINLIWLIIFVFSLFPVHAPLFQGLYNAIPSGYSRAILQGKGLEYCSAIANDTDREICYYNLSSGGYPVNCDSLDPFVKERCEGKVDHCGTIEAAFPVSMDDYYQNYATHLNPVSRYQCFHRAATWNGFSFERTASINEWALVTLDQCLSQPGAMKDFCLFNLAISQKKFDACDQMTISDTLKKDCKDFKYIGITEPNAEKIDDPRAQEIRAAVSDKVLGQYKACESLIDKDPEHQAYVRQSCFQYSIDEDNGPNKYPWLADENPTFQKVQGIALEARTANDCETELTGPRRDVCMDMLANRLKDPSICSKISLSAVYSEACKNIIQGIFLYKPTAANLTRPTCSKLWEIYQCAIQAAPSKGAESWFVSSSNNIFNPMAGPQDYHGVIVKEVGEKCDITYNGLDNVFAAYSSDPAQTEKERLVSLGCYR